MDVTAEERALLLLLRDPDTSRRALPCVYRALLEAEKQIRRQYHRGGVIPVTALDVSRVVTLRECLGKYIEAYLDREAVERAE